VSADLRARIADALTNWVLNASRSAEASRIVPIPETVHANSLLRADVVMTVIQPELDAKDARIAELEAELKGASDAYWREREQHEADRLAKDTEIGRLRRELAEACRRYEERTPTQWAYEQACHALERHRERAEQAEVKLASTRRLLDNRVQDCVDLTQRAEQAEAELEQWRACFGETALKDARGVLAERDRLRAADGRVRQALAKWDEDTVHDADALGLLLDDLRAALDQAPADEPDDYAARLSPTRVVSVAANSIGYAIQQVCHLDLHVDAVTAAAQRLYDQGLLKTPVDGQFAEDWTATEEQQNATHGNEAQQ
jgi:hypothetical protein